MNATRRYEPGTKQKVYALVAEVGVQEAARQSGVPVGTIHSWIYRDRKNGNEVPPVDPANGEEHTDKQRYEIVLEARREGFKPTARKHGIAPRTLFRWEEELAAGKNPRFPLPPRERQPARPEDTVLVNGAALRAAREAAGIKQGEAARRLGIPQPTYYRYETGRAIVPLSRLTEIAGFLGLVVDDLVLHKE